MAVMTITPRDVAVLIDKFQVLLDRPSTFSQHQGLSVTSEIPPDALREFIEAARDLDGSPSVASPIPRATRRLDD